MGRATMRRGINVSMRATAVSNFIKRMQEEKETVPRGTSGLKKINK